MPKTKIATSAISDGICTLHYYSAPADGEQQHVAATLRYYMKDLPEHTLLDLAAYGFASVAGNRYQRANSDAHPDVPAIANALYAEIKAGDWHPGKPTADSEPSDLMKAISEAMKVPLSYVQEQFETKMDTRNDGTLVLDKKGKPRRYYNATRQRQLAADPQLVPILARLAQERARALAAAAKDQAKAPSKLAALFTPPASTDPASTDPAAPETAS